MSLLVFNLTIVNLKVHLWLVLSIFSTSGLALSFRFAHNSLMHVFTNLEQVFARNKDIAEALRERSTANEP